MFEPYIGSYFWPEGKSVSKYLEDYFRKEITHIRCDFMAPSEKAFNCKIIEVRKDPPIYRDYSKRIIIDNKGRSEILMEDEPHVKFSVVEEGIKVCFYFSSATVVWYS